MAKLLMVVKKVVDQNTNEEFSRDTWYKLMIVSLGKNTKNFLMKSYLRYVAVIHYGVWLLF
jgi:hypothetical protein